jgi:hypothetical protein
VVELLYHCKAPSHGWVGTLNRLVRKGPALENSVGERIECTSLPPITAEALSVRRERWSLDQLLEARSPKPHLRDKPLCDTCPILVLQILGKRFTIDGGTRTNRRIREHDQGPHDVIVIECDLGQTA